MPNPVTARSVARKHGFDQATMQRLYSDAFDRFMWVQDGATVLEVNPTAAALAWVDEFGQRSAHGAPAQDLVTHARRFPIQDND